MRIKRFVLFALIVVVVFVVSLVGIRIVSPSWDQRLPDPSMVKSLNAELSFDAPKNLPAVPVFQVPVEDIPVVLRAIGKGRRDFFPAKWHVLGDLTITTTDGRKIEVHLFSTGAESGAFAVGPWGRQIYYLGGNSAEVEDTIRSAYSKVKEKK